MCSSSSACSSSAWSLSSSDDLVDARGPRHLLQREAPGHEEPEDHGGDQVEGDGRHRRDDEHERVAAGGAQQGAQARDLDHLHRGRDQHAGERGERDAGDPARARPGSRAAAPADWVTAASRDRAPVRTLTAVRAMAAVAGMPPKSGTTRLAMPWPNSSRSGSCRSPTLMPSATVAESRLSSAASAATATAGSSSAPSWPGSDAGQRGGRAAGRDRADGRDGRWAAATTSGRDDDRGQRHGQAGTEPGREQHRTGDQAGDQDGRPLGSASPGGSASTADARTFSPARRTPSAAGTCCRAMMMAMPTVKPSTTGSGT